MWEEGKKIGTKKLEDDKAEVEVWDNKGHDVCSIVLGVNTWWLSVAGTLWL